MKITTERLTLIPCTLENYKDIAQQFKLGPHVDFYLGQLQRDPSLAGWGVWFAVLSINGQAVGDLGFKGKPDISGTVDIGYGIIAETRQKGYASEAVKALIQWAFSTGEVIKVTADCLEDNVPSIRVLEKVGMKTMGVQNGKIYWEIKKGSSFQTASPEF